MNRPLRRRLIVLALALGLLVPLAAAQPAAGFVDRDCSDFSSQREAQRFFENHHPRRDPHRLDADHDGIACEDLP